MSKPTRTTVSNFLLIFGDVVVNNVLDQSLEGLEKITSMGCNIRIDMVTIISSKPSKRRSGSAHYTSPPWMRGSKGLQPSLGRIGAAK
eukprot:scaffold70597_cov40-Attheya_sp.AAC.2